MAEPLSISVVVATRARPEMLLRCLRAVDQLIWPAFEVVVVADKSGRDAVASRSKAAPPIKLVPCDQANIALARNLGIAASGGDVIAFIDDDSVPEPMWLAALADAFSDGAVGAATGPVLGRNGISVQSGAETILPTGETVPAGGNPSRRRASAAGTPKTVGTNMAFRSSLLREVGGFDESFRYLFEDADLNVRLGALGVVTAFQANAVVHHSRAPSIRRRGDQAPRDLFDIGRSTAIFVSRHAGDQADQALEAARRLELRRVEQRLIDGRLEPRDLRQLRTSFHEGVEKAKTKDMSPRFHAFSAYETFEPRRRHSWKALSIGASIMRQNEALKAAADASKDNSIVSLFVLSRTALYHRVSFSDGVWDQRGGAFGRSDRSGSVIQLSSRRKRFQAEIARVSGGRGLNGSFATQIPENCVVTEASLSFF